ncbi:helix-turn-helix domain-containing protein [Pseudoflavonifractor phocaeensis]|uniref:helix-turn-helix domain-containing protein n=1 Tax=Pseudoflavonifractor phocaeensis TaxID=1870988 RepID=UPI0019565003|nr:helix-turn-helix transcriptional regulator [Pseudoflavonifractor phocaeensis]MBM6870788.1 helix-turn-helix transcriptional regulator [Pseudoflavonifractor phocaeensis]
MPDNGRNIYKAAREARGLTQEAAAERLGISDSSIRAYETGQRIPPNDVVDDMVLAYDSQLLGIQHLRASADMARSIVPDVREVRLPEAIMSLLDRVYAFTDAHRDRELLRIGKDGVIDDTERPEFEAILTELQGIVEAAMQVRCAKINAISMR